MKTHLLPFLLSPAGLAASFFLIFSLSARANEPQRLESRIESIDVFKNGFAVVHRVVEPAEAGTYRVEGIPRPVHGTFWIGSEAPVVARMTMAEVEVPLAAADLGDMQASLAGLQVTVHFQEGIPPVTGIVVPRTSEHVKPQWEHGAGFSRNVSLARQQEGRFLILRTAEGHAYVDPTRIAHLLVQDEREFSIQQKPVMLLTIEAEQQEPISISYLTYGFAWAPSYRVNLLDGVLTLEQQAVMKNEMAGFDQAELRLISGYPNIPFAHVTSPLSLETSWSAFIRQLNQRHVTRGQGLGSVTSNVLSQVSVRTSGAELVLPVEPQDAGVDLHYESIGRRSMNEGDALTLTVARGDAEYERIVEWIVPDTRDAFGRMQNTEITDDMAWDAVRFRNPLRFAMTTAPAMINDRGRFAGQSMSSWVNTGQSTTLHITQALSIQTRALEVEVAEEERETVYVGGRRFRKVNVQGTLEIGNPRNEPVQMVIRRRFSGNLLEADGEPSVSFLEEGVYSANRRNELTWTESLESGEARTLGFIYDVLVSF